MKRTLPMLAALMFSSFQLGLSQWTNIQSPELSIPLAIYSMILRGDTIWVGTYRSTIYRSTDNGITWARSDSGTGTMNCTYDFYFDGDTLFAIGEYGIYRSTDMGESWVLKNTGLFIGSWVNVFSMVRLGNQLFVGTPYGVYRSSNNGDTWSPSTGTAYYWEVYSLAVLNGNLYAGSISEGIFRSTNNGLSWTPVNNGLPANPSGYISSIHKLLVDGNQLYAGTNSMGVYRSSDHGNLWLPETTAFGRDGLGETFKSVFALHMVGGNLYAGTLLGGIYSLPASGGSWINVTGELPEDSYVTALGNRGDTLYATIFGSGLVYLRSTDTITWAPLFRNVSVSAAVQTIGSSGANLLLSATAEYYNGSEYGAYYSPDFGTTWFRDSMLAQSQVRTYRSYGDSVYALSNHLFFSSDRGAHWVALDSGCLPLNDIIRLNDTLIGIWGMSYRWDNEAGGVLLSTDGGSSWIEQLSVDTAFYSLTHIRNTWFASGSQGVYRSTDAGLNWVLGDSGLPMNPWVYTLTVLGDTLFACTWHNIYRSTDLGSSWSQLTNGLPADTLGYRNPVFLLSHENILFAGTYDGVYISSDAGQNWFPVDNSLEGDAKIIKSLTVLDDFLYSASAAGIWRHSLSGVVSVEDHGSRRPVNIHLGQNYPNPFNPSTTIRYYLPSEGRVSIVIYDLRGNKILTLLDQVQEAGEHELVWKDVLTIASGIYFYQLRIGSFIETKKLVFVR